MNVNKPPSSVAGNRQLGAAAFTWCYYDQIHYSVTKKCWIYISDHANSLLWPLGFSQHVKSTNCFKRPTLDTQCQEWDNSCDRLGIENCGQTFKLTVLINSNISMIAELNKLYLSPLARKASQTAFKWLFCTMCRLYVSSFRFINLRKNRTAPASKK